MTDNKEFPEHIKGVFDFFLTRYTPVEKGTVTTLRKTTLEIFEQMQEHCPSASYDITDVFDFLSKNKFTYDTPAGDLEFVWLLQYKAVK